MSKPRSPYKPGDRIHAMVPGPALSCGVVVSTESRSDGKWNVTADMGDDGHRNYRSVRNDGSSDYTNRPQDSLTKWCGKCFPPEDVQP